MQARLEREEMREQLQSSVRKIEELQVKEAALKAEVALLHDDRSNGMPGGGGAGAGGFDDELDDESLAGGTAKKKTMSDRIKEAKERAAAAKASLTKAVKK